MGRLTVIIGCMFAEKTTELLRHYRRAKRAGQKCLMVKPVKDTRYSETNVVSHNHDSERAVVVTMSREVLDLATDIQNVFFDEGQFFPDLAETADGLLKNGVNVFVSALRSDFRRNPFPVVSTLLARANGGITWLTAVCVSCGEDATESKLIAKVQVGDNSEYIGGEEAYVPMCLSCYFKEDDYSPQHTKNELSRNE